MHVNSLPMEVQKERLGLSTSLSESPILKRCATIICLSAFRDRPDKRENWLERDVNWKAILSRRL